MSAQQQELDAKNAEVIVYICARGGGGYVLLLCSILFRNCKNVFNYNKLRNV